MPSLTHEALVQRVRRNPELVLSLIWPDGQIPPYTTIHLAPADFVDLNFPEYRADLVLAIGDDPDQPEGIFIIEGQIDKDPQKHESRTRRGRLGSSGRSRPGARGAVGPAGLARAREGETQQKRADRAHDTAADGRLATSPPAPRTPSASPPAAELTGVG